MRGEIAAGSDGRNDHPFAMEEKSPEEILECHRALLLRWATKYSFEPPPTVGGWHALHEYEERNAAPIHEADIMEEIEEIRSRRS